MGRISAQIKDAYDSGCDAWHRFWFSESDPTVLCIMRILVGCMVTYTVFVWGLKFDAFLGDHAWNSPTLLAEVQADGFAPSFWWYVPAEARWAVHCGCLVILASFAVGLFTRATSILSMAILISYSYRAHLANYGLDQINALLTFYLCIAPCGARFSVDQMIRKKRGKPTVVRPSVAANLATRLTQVHFCVIYSFAGLAKLQGEGWWNGEAIWMAVANSEYQTMDMTWIAWYPWISDIATHTTILFELTFWVLVWGRCRPVVLATAAALHIGIGAMMGMWTFAFIMIFGHLSFWSPALVNRLLKRLSGEEPKEALPESSSESSIALSAASTSLTEESLPRIVYVDADQTARIRCLTYFTSRGFECYATQHSGEAIHLLEALQPSAFIVVGSNFDDDTLQKFHQLHSLTAPQTHAFYAVSEERTGHLSATMSSDNSVLVSDSLSLGGLRRVIEKQIRTPQLVSVSSGTPQATPSTASLEDGSCEDAVPNKPR
ncbi:MAG: HTTM domain-containing protein [Planctomycetaceae bacterium]